MDYQDSIIRHYENNWNTSPKIYYWDKGPSNELPYDFRVLEFSPNKERKMWTYATCCMSQKHDKEMIELHIFSAKQDDTLIELLTAIAHYHRTSSHLGLNHSVNFGRPWQDNSKCEYGFISLPYMDGPKLENLKIEENHSFLKCYWLIPITKAEVEYKKEYGVAALENLFEEKKFNYLDSKRLSVV